jgi:hypothetical protein
MGSEAVSGDGKRLVRSRTAANEGPGCKTVSPSKGFTERDRSDRGRARAARACRLLRRWAVAGGGRGRGERGGRVQVAECGRRRWL